LNQQPHYVLFDDAAGLSRASELGLRIAPEAWKKVTLELKPSGITPFWLTTKSGMHSAARVAFEDSADDRISSIKSGDGVLVSVEQSGVTFARDPDDDNGGDVFWMSED